jgi:histidinol-phosphate aminotransferase
MPPRWRPVLAEILPYVVPPPLDALAAELGQPVLRLSANENPLGPSPLAVAAIRREAERIHLYPDGGAPALAEAVADTLGVKPTQLLFGNGGDEILTLLGRALLEPGDEVIVPEPSFEPYTTTARLADALVVPSPLRDYRVDLDDVLARVGPRTKLVCLSSPHNPTGTVLERRAWERFCARCPDDVMVLLDEAYVDFIEAPDRAADGLAALAARPESLVLLRTFSKITGLAGLRVGYAIAQPGVIGQLERTREPFNVGRVAQAGAAAAARDSAHREATRQVVWAERRALAAAFAARGLSHPPTQANFLLVRVDRPTGPVLAALRAQGVLVRDGAAVGYPAHLRISVGTREQNARLLAALDRALAG